MSLDEIRIIRCKIKERVHSWSAGSTSVSDLPPEKRKARLGLYSTDEEMKAAKINLAEEEAIAAHKGLSFIYPPRWDWRNVSNIDWTTPVKDDGDGGACVAFAVIAAIESSLKIFRRTSKPDPDLSEADLFSQGCGTGGDIVATLRIAHSSGIPDDACYPYNGEGPCPDRDKRTVKIDNWRAIYSISQAKEWISARGPLVMGMEASSDFFYYRSGVYTPEYGDGAGTIAICVVGYDDAEGCWICKNCWGTEWGEAGWFKIAYGVCGVGSSFAFYTTEFASSSELGIPKAGKVTVRFKSKMTAFDDELWLAYPDERLILKASSNNLGKTYDVGTFVAGTRLTFMLKTPEGEAYYTDSSLNRDGCDHVRKLQLGIDRWELRWEDMYGLGEQDFNDVVLDVDVGVADATESANRANTVRAPSKDAVDRSSKSIDDNPSTARSSEPQKSTLGQSLSSSVAGNTTDSYVVILSLNCLTYLKKTLVLACTHGSNDLKYRIKGYAKSGSMYYDELWADVNLAHGDVQPLVIENFYNMITVEVKSATSGLASSYVLDYCGGP